MTDATDPVPTERELAILKVLWEQGEASVREVYEALREHLPIVQNTVQAFLRTMEAKGLVTHRTEGRSFIYQPTTPREDTNRSMLSGLLDRVFDGAMDELVENAFALRRPTDNELQRLRDLIDQAEAAPSKRDDDAPGKAPS
ncbi:MAG: transcriptional regulator [Planctomycetota bacterium]|nr:MAG: transcriptional regulator [Planctomycetota bacterium]